MQMNSRSFGESVPFSHVWLDVCSSRRRSRGLRRSVLSVMLPFGSGRGRSVLPFPLRRDSGSIAFPVRYAARRRSGFSTSSSSGSRPWRRPIPAAAGTGARVHSSRRSATGDGDDLILGSDRDDALTFSGTGNDRLFGGAGNDRITGGAGRDAIDAGAGDDRVLARDRTRDTIRCGVGRDTVVADRVDALARDCEIVRRR